MPKLLNLLAVSVGGGIALGAVLRSGRDRIADESLEARLSKLEKEVGSHDAALSELRECTLQAAQSSQRLLDGIERLLASQRTPGIPPVTRTGDSESR